MTFESILTICKKFSESFDGKEPLAHTWHLLKLMFCEAILLGSVGWTVSLLLARPAGKSIPFMIPLLVHEHVAKWWSSSKWVLWSLLYMLINVRPLVQDIYVLAITGNNCARCIAVFLMAAGVFVIFCCFSRILTHWNQIAVIQQYLVFRGFKFCSMFILTSATDGNRCSSILPNNGHYKKCKHCCITVNLRCVLSL